MVRSADPTKTGVVVEFTPVPRVLAILEDNAARVCAMRACLAQISPDAHARFFDNAQQMIAWLGKHLAEVDLLSLDHDLPVRFENGKSIDSGTGRHVADYLASVRPTCPVIIHSSNDACAVGMFYALKDADWHCSRVYPRDGEAWIADAWLEEVQRCLPNMQM